MTAPATPPPAPRRRGRPALGLGPTREIRLYEADDEQVAALAAAAEVPVAEFLRDLVQTALQPGRRRR